MALNTQLSAPTVEAQANALAALLDGGYLRLYDGTQPADANTPITSQNKLAELRLGSPAFGTSVAGAIAAEPITSDEDAAMTGDPHWYRAFAADGTTAIMDGSVGPDGTYNLNFPPQTIQQHAKVSITGWIHSVPE